MTEKFDKVNHACRKVWAMLPLSILAPDTAFAANVLGREITTTNMLIVWALAALIPSFSIVEHFRSRSEAKALKKKEEPGLYNNAPKKEGKQDPVF